jgi:zinc transport system ATP-binding protein
MHAAHQQAAEANAAPSPDRLDVSGMTIRFDHQIVLTNLSFTVADGATVAIIGPNGSGKSVLLRALIGAIPFEGTVRWGADTRLGYVPQKLDIARDVPLTGLDLLRAKLALTHRNSRPLELLESVGLAGETGRRPIGELSGGQFQRLLLASALAGEANVLLLDEATAGVDQPGQERLYELISRLRRTHALTVLLISHDLSIVYREAAAVLCLGGPRYSFGPPRDVLTPEHLREIYGAPVAFHVHDH